MIDPVAIQLLQTPALSGLYESFYFRGTSTDGRFGWWLKHNLLRQQGESRVLVENALITFDRNTCSVRVAHQQEFVDADDLQARLGGGNNWDYVHFTFASGAYFRISRDHIEGRINDKIGASWQLSLTRSDETLWHYPYDLLYRAPFPKKKVLTRDCHLVSEGKVQCGDQRLNSEYTGMNGHNWGSEHAHAYAYADCCEFDEGDAYFDAFSARVAIAGGLITTPFFSMASLQWGGEWFHFNDFLASLRQKVALLNDYRWSATLKNRTHLLELDIDGERPDKEPWVGLHYAHPSGKISVVKNTKFARGTLRLYDRHRHKLLIELNTDRFELETLLPNNRPSGPDYQGKA